jgi:hypothetical protein
MRSIASCSGIESVRAASGQVQNGAASTRPDRVSIVSVVPGASRCIPSNTARSPAT